MKKLVMVLIGLALLVGCATPSGKLTDKDFIIKTINVSYKVPDALYSFWSGMKYRGPDYGIADCSPIKSNGSAICDMYGPQLFGGRSDWVLGRVEFVPTQEGSEIIFKIQTWLPDRRIKSLMCSWELFVLDRAKETCPQSKEGVIK
jgi:hypothetical protein